jgi:hypothetical protein
MLTGASWVSSPPWKARAIVVLAFGQGLRLSWSISLPPVPITPRQFPRRAGKSDPLKGVFEAGEKDSTFNGMKGFRLGHGTPSSDSSAML